MLGESNIVLLYGVGACSVSKTVCRQLALLVRSKEMEERVPREFIVFMLGE